MIWKVFKAGKRFCFSVFSLIITLLIARYYCLVPVFANNENSVNPPITNIFQYGYRTWGDDPARFEVFSSFSYYSIILLKH